LIAGFIKIFSLTIPENKLVHEPELSRWRRSVSCPVLCFEKVKNTVCKTATAGDVVV